MPGRPVARRDRRRLRPRERRAAELVALLALTMSSAGCQLAPGAPEPPQASRRATSPATAPGGVVDRAAGAIEQLEALPIEPQTDGATYTRSAYGPRWADVNSTGCNTRDQVLFTAAATGTVRTGQQGRCAHDVVAGTWTDFYTGRALTFTDLKDPRQAPAVTLDHLNALAEADRSGASSWPADSKERFANDPANLRVTAGAVNSSKGDRDPATWQPPPAARCAYATAYTSVKTTWRLTVDQAEHDALRQLLESCRHP